MEVDFDELREKIRSNFNDLVLVANNSTFRYDEEYLLVHPESLEIAIDDLRTDIAILLAIINPESGKTNNRDLSFFDLSSIDIEQ